MTLLRRQKLTVTSLLFYWPSLFVLTHISPAYVQGWTVRVDVSDKILHYFAYLVLVFLLWFATNPYKKVNWRKAAVWWIILVVVWYGVFDEWLQGYVGRDCDVMDFFADLAGALTSLIILSIINFWLASIIITGISIFVLTNLTQISSVELFPVTAILFVFFFF